MVVWPKGVQHESAYEVDVCFFNFFMREKIVTANIDRHFLNADGDHPVDVSRVSCSTTKYKAPRSAHEIVSEFNIGLNALKMMLVTFR